MGENEYGIPEPQMRRETQASFAHWVGDGEWINFVVNHFTSLEEAALLAIVLSAQPGHEGHEVVDGVCQCPIW